MGGTGSGYDLHGNAVKVLLRQGFADRHAEFRHHPEYDLHAANLLHRMLAQITDASAAILLPPSYADALDFNLAVRIAPEFGQDIPAVVAELAVSLKAKIQRKNLRMETVAPDGYGRGGYDIRTDRFI
jgi:hypothetical protein